MHMNKQSSIKQSSFILVLPIVHQLMFVTEKHVQYKFILAAEKTTTENSMCSFQPIFNESVYYLLMFKNLHIV